MKSIELLPADPKDRKRLGKKVLIGAGVITGVVVAAVVIRKLTTIEVEIETLVEVAQDIVESADGLTDAVDAVGVVLP